LGGEEKYYGGGKVGRNLLKLTFVRNDLKSAISKERVRNTRKGKSNKNEEKNHGGSKRAMMREEGKNSFLEGGKKGDSEAKEKLLAGVTLPNGHKSCTLTEKKPTTEEKTDRKRARKELGPGRGGWLLRQQGAETKK